MIGLICVSLHEVFLGMPLISMGTYVFCLPRNIVEQIENVIIQQHVSDSFMGFIGSAYLSEPIALRRFFSKAVINNSIVYGQILKIIMPYSHNRVYGD